MKKSAKAKKPLKKTKAVKKATDQNDILEIILKDHKPLKKLIKTMKNSEATLPELRKAFSEFAPLLLNHAKPEEKALYVPMKERDSDIRTEGFEGDTEHHIADGLIEEIKATTDKDEWRARVKVLAELVEHHIEEEEEDMFKDVRKEFDLEERVEMGQEYSRLYQDFSGEVLAAA
ncbi:MAG: hemerythrin domain-containing protein [Bacteriovoracia bacterium]